MKLDHINIVTEDLDETVAFFTDVLGLSVGPRPNFSSQGAWMYGAASDDVAIVHIVVGQPNTGDGGALDHIAFRGTDTAKLKEKLDDAGIVFETRVVPGTGDTQVFFVAPFGTKFEVNFAPGAA